MRAKRRTRFSGHAGSSDNRGMLTRMAYRHLRARWKQWRGEGDPQWAEKIAVCAQCPLRTARGGVFYCGSPVWDRLHDPAQLTNTVNGCGCPLHVKARDRESHCPLSPAGGAVDPDAKDAQCPCKWCSALRANSNSPGNPDTPAHAAVRQRLRVVRTRSHPVAR